MIHWASRFYRVSPLTNKSSAISYSLSVKSETSQEGTREGAALALVSLFACHSPVISHDISTWRACLHASILDLNLSLTKNFLLYVLLLIYNFIQPTLVLPPLGAASTSVSDVAPCKSQIMKLHLLYFLAYSFPPSRMKLFQKGQYNVALTLGGSHPTEVIIQIKLYLLCSKLLL